LDIPGNVFAEALAFKDANAEMIVEVYENNGEKYLRLGKSARYNCRLNRSPVIGPRGATIVYEIHT